MQKAAAVTSSVEKKRLEQPEILIVDDDPDLQIILHDLLESEGYAVTEASTCREALLRAQTQFFDAVLLDIGLPDGDGLSVLNHFQESVPSLSVIMLTAATSTDLYADVLAQGAFTFLSKPYDHNELRLLVRQAIRTTANNGPTDNRTIHEPTGSEARLNGVR
ncbi:MAG TPA: response regulator [Nitrospira sp.]|nr:response regulator [Nitrospira sp.]